MAFQSKGRDPLFDSSMREQLERRGKELIGIGVLVFGLVFGVMLLSYSPIDPSWMSSSDAPVQNWLGHFGASLAAPIMMVMGYGTVTLAALALVWGVRFAAHIAEDQALNRLLFAPVVMVLASVYFGTLTPGRGWDASFGLGGLFGDTVLGALLLALPLPLGVGVRLMSLLLGVMTAASFLWVGGFNREEGRRVFRTVLIGLVMAYALLLRLLGRSATGAMGAASEAMERRRMKARDRAALRMSPQEDDVVWDDDDGYHDSDPEADRYWAERAAQQAEERRSARVLRAEQPRYEEPARVPAPEPEYEPGHVPEYEQAYADEPAYDEPEHAYAESERPARGGLLSRLPGFRRSSPEEEDAPAAFEHAEPMGDDDRIKAKIANVVRNRAGRGAAPARQMPLTGNGGPRTTRPRSRAPLLISDRVEPPMQAQDRGLPPEPPVTAASMGASMGAARQPVADYEASYDDGYGEAPLTIPPAPEFDLKGGSDAYEVFDREDDFSRGQPASYAQPAYADPAPRPEQRYEAQGLDAGFEEDYGYEEEAYGDQAHEVPSPAPRAEPVRSEPMRAEPPLRTLTRESGAGDYRPDTLDEDEDDFDGYDDMDAARAYAAGGHDDGGDDYDPRPAVPAASRQPVAAPRKVVQHGLRSQTPQAARARVEEQPDVLGRPKHPDYELPPLGLLTNPSEIQRHYLSDEALEENARMLENVLDDYGVKGEIVSVRPGPVVTMYELEPAPGLKASRVIGLADDIARSMSALSARVSTVPGRSVIGIELPNDNREMVVLREILSARDFEDPAKKLPLALGKDIGGDAVVANLAKMPHLLIAGTTGSGKSVAINTMILSLLYRLTPEDCRLIMIDPKMLELSVYDGIPHLLSPVVTDPKKAVVALKWVVAEMEERYRKMSKMGVRNIDGYNSRVQETLNKGEMFSRTVQTGFDEETGDPVFETEEIQPVKMPYIVVIVDEMADLMMVAGKEIEACIQRLAQMARASGIHLIMATQRPSVDVITGTIKANFPTRISFQVTSKIDSRTILGEQGAEQLLGMGDMLYMAGGSRITRCHGPFVSDEEVEEVVNHLKAFGPPDYVGGVVEGPDDEKSADIDAVLGLNTGGNTGGEDALYDQAVAIVIKDRKCSTSYIQRKLAIGYNKAARLVEQMEEEGVVSPANHVGKREVLVPEQQ